MERAEGWKAQFASDNAAGMCPESMAAIAAVAGGFAPGYGEDRHSAAGREALRGLLGRDCAAYFMASGTAANCLSLAAFVRPHHGIFCHESAHLGTDEAGAPHFITGGASLFPLAGAGGKLTPATLLGSEHHQLRVHSPRPRALSIANSTELGTVYSPAEHAALAAAAGEKGLVFHVDGARFANACAAAAEREGMGPAEAARALSAGADVLCLGGCKDGIALTDAVVFFDLEAAAEFGWMLKQAGQMQSKSRFYAAPWAGALGTGLWFRNAARANAAAAELEARLRAAGYDLAHPREANALFVRMTEAQAQRLRGAGWTFYGMLGGYRFMCSWATTEEAIDELVADCREAADLSRADKL